MLFPSLTFLLLASEQTLIWGLSQTLSSMCALCLLTQEELRGANPAFTVHTVWASILLTAVMETGDGKLRSSQWPLVFTCIWHLNLSDSQFFFLIYKMGELSPYNVFVVRLKEMISTKYSKVFDHISELNNYFSLSKNDVLVGFQLFNFWWEV